MAIIVCVHRVLILFIYFKYLQKYLPSDQTLNNFAQVYDLSLKCRKSRSNLCWPMQIAKSAKGQKNVTSCLKLT